MTIKGMDTDTRTDFLKVGTATAGGVLTADKGTWVPATTTYKYQWYTNGSVISGATNATYKARTGDPGTAITAKVTATRTGYLTTTTTTTSAGVGIG